MKKLSNLLAALILFLIIFTGCTEDKTAYKNESHEKSKDFLILWEGNGLEKQTAYLIETELCRMGYTAVTKKAKDKAVSNPKCIITVGENAESLSKSSNIPTISCIPEGGIASRKADVYPYMGTKDMARAAVLLLPSAEEFALISEENGAADVQDACDYFDMGGIDYTVEITDGRSLGDTVLSATDKGCDAVILPMHALEGLNVEPLSNSCAIIAIGEGEAVRGSLASFCIDVELLSRHTAALAVSKIENKEWIQKSESYYIVCISEKESKNHSIDPEALKENFKVVSVE